jgi:hypothetical protein
LYILYLVLSPPSAPDHATSPVTGVLLLIGITIILVMLVLLLCLGFRLPVGETSIPAVFKITKITYTPDSNGINSVGLVTISNTDSINYRNRYLKVITYVNGNLADCNIPTLNNDWFCTLNHNGVSRLWGVGTWGNRNFQTSVWPAGSDISIEYKKGRLHPGDRVTLEFVDTRTNQIISSDTYPHTTERDVQWFYNYFLNPQSA